MAVCSEIHTKHINTVCGQNVELLNVKLAVHIVTTGLQRVKSHEAATEWVKIKVKVTLGQATKAHRESRRIALPFL